MIILCLVNGVLGTAAVNKRSKKLIALELSFVTTSSNLVNDVLSSTAAAELRDQSRVYVLLRGTTPL